MNIQHELNENGVFIVVDDTYQMTLSDNKLILHGNVGYELGLYELSNSQNLPSNTYATEILSKEYVGYLEEDNCLSLIENENYSVMHDSNDENDIHGYAHQLNIGNNTLVISYYTTTYGQYANEPQNLIITSLNELRSYVD